MTGADRDRVQQWINATPEGLSAPGSEARMAAIFLCEEDGTRLYESDNAAHIDELNEMPITFIRAVNQKGNRISGLIWGGGRRGQGKFSRHPERRFYFRLARDLGGLTVGELLARISSAELTEWVAIYLLENEEAKQREVERQVKSGVRGQLSRPRPRR